MDPVAGRWVITAPERAARPRDFPLAKRQRKGGFCPLCEGNEDKTPDEVLAFRPEGSQPNTPGWRVRVVPNKYPFLQAEGEPHEEDVGAWRRMGGIGVHEIVVESPRHITSPAEAPADELHEVICAYRQRILHWKADGRLDYALIFKNVGDAAGASLEHSHSQLVCTPVVPKRVLEEMDRCGDYWRSRGRCVLCDILAGELAGRERLVAESDNFAVITPYASRFPFEMWLMPREHGSHFEDTSPDLLGELARVLREVLSRLDVSLGEPPYNYVLHTAPLKCEPAQHYHWHLEVIPRLTHVAGFEWGTGFYVNPVLPEEAARCLRDVTLRTDTAGVSGALAR